MSHFPPHFFDIATTDLGVDPFCTGIFGWPCGASFFWGLGHAPNQDGQALHGSLAVHLLASVLPGFDDDDALVGDAVVRQEQKSLFVHLRQGGCLDVEPQVDGGCGCVDVLPAGAGRFDGGQFDLIVGKGDAI